MSTEEKNKINETPGQIEEEVEISEEGLNEMRQIRREKLKILQEMC